MSNFYMQGSSYGIKHVAERETDGVNIPNGVFIAAAIAEGFQVKLDGKGPNALLNIDPKVGEWRERLQRQMAGEKKVVRFYGPRGVTVGGAR